MADVTAYMGVDPALSDVRREGVEHTSQILHAVSAEEGRTREVIATKTDELNDDIKSTGWDISKIVQAEANRLGGKATDFFIAQQQADSASKVELAKIASSVDAGFASIAQLSEKNNQISALSTQKYVSEDGEKTRALINDLKNADLNRMLIERNSDVNYYRADGDRWESIYGNGQFAAISSQINALGSNLESTRQGLYNFGFMADTNQRSTTNQVH